MNKKICCIILDVFLCCVMVALLVIGFLNVNAMRRYSPVSVRYNEPISGQDAYQLRRFSIEQGRIGQSGIEYSGVDQGGIVQGDANVFWPTFWHEKQAKIESDLRTIFAPCIVFSGDSVLVWQANYINGAAPGVTDGVGCAVSSALAFELWGGNDVVGKPINVDGEERVVRGVFESELLLALLSVRDEDTSRSFTAIELSGNSSSTTRSDVQDFIRSAGLDAPDIILIDRPAHLAFFLFLLPLMVFTIYAVVRFIIRLKKRPVLIYVIVFLVLLGFAFLLPALLALLPSWMIPSRFSDFSFWGGMISQLGEDLTEYLRLTPRLRDVAFMILFYKQIGITFVSVILAVILCFRHYQAFGLP